MGDKKPDSYVENSHILPYGSNISAPAIKLENIEGWKGQKIGKANEYFSTKLQEIKKEYENLVAEFEWNGIVFNSEYNFEPIIGKEYFLYKRENDSFFLSMIEPTEWDKNYIGSFRMTTDNKWEKLINK